MIRRRFFIWNCHSGCWSRSKRAVVSVAAVHVDPVLEAEEEAGGAGGGQKKI